MGDIDELNVQAIACSQQVEEHGSVDVVQGQRLALQILSFGQVSSLKIEHPQLQP